MQWPNERYSFCTYEVNENFIRISRYTALRRTFCTRIIHHGPLFRHSLHLCQPRYNHSYPSQRCVYVISGRLFVYPCSFLSIKVDRLSAVAGRYVVHVSNYRGKLLISPSRAYYDNSTTSRKHVFIEQLRENSDKEWHVAFATGIPYVRSSQSDSAVSSSQRQKDIPNRRIDWLED